MLYDPKWEQPKPDIFALDTLIGWLEQQTPTKLYRYSSPRNCLLAQYFTAMFGMDMTATHHYVYPEDDSPVLFDLPRGWDDIAKGARFRPIHTFGGALKRAKRLRAKAAVGSILSRIPQLLGLT